jgi:hypothetical protein
MELASLVTTNFVNDQFYRSADESLERMRELVSQVDPMFAAQAAVYVRNTDGLRSITHAVAGEIGKSVKGEQWTKDFFRAVVRRPDDVTEILAYYMGRYGKPIPNSMKKGLGSALGKFDEYQLAKYRGEGRGLTLVDAVNLIHARPSAKNREALAKLVNGTLRSSGTRESVMSAAGSDVEKKAEAWDTLLREGKIGYLALLRNLRNIATQAPELVPRACELLVDPNRVHKSLVLPFQYIIAVQECRQYPRIVKAISDAVDVSLDNIPDLGERVYIAVDGSGSMGSPASGNTGLTRKYVGSLFAAALYKKSFADVAVFGNDCHLVPGLNPADSTLTNAEKVFAYSRGQSTNFPSVFQCASGQRKVYDTVVIFSDMQAWVRPIQYGSSYYAYYGASHPGDAFADYKRVTKANPKVFAFDLSGLGTAQFPEKDIYEIAGFSDKTLALMSKLREDPRALVNAIKAVKF